MARIRLRRDTAANWITANPILLQGEPGLEVDTGKTKHGNGTATWSQLPYSATTGYTGSVGSQGAVGYTGSAGVGSQGAVGYTGSAGAAGVTGLVSNGTNTVTLSSGFNLIPATNVLQDLGSPTNRFKDLYLSGNTIDLGGATISSDNGALALPVGTKIGTVSVNFDSFGNNILPPGSDQYDIGSISALWRYVYGAVFVGNMLQQWSPSGTVRSVRIDRILAKTSQSVPTTPVGTGPDTNTGFLGDKLGDVTWSVTHMYVCTANWDGVTNIWKRISWGSDTWT